MAFFLKCRFFHCCILYFYLTILISKHKTQNLCFCSALMLESMDHRLNTPNPKCRLYFNRVYRLERQSVMLVFSAGFVNY